MPMVTAVLVVVFGGLTFWLDDPQLHQDEADHHQSAVRRRAVRRPADAAGPLLKLLLGEAFNLTDEGWRKLSVRWAVFFLALAVLNEIVWRNFSEAPGSTSRCSASCRSRSFSPVADRA